MATGVPDAGPTGTPDLRRVTDDEWVAFCRAWSHVFHEAHDDDAAVAWRTSLPAERCWTATDDVGYVASSGAIPFGLSVPGGATVRCAGVTIVTVRPDHRRRGLLRAMMARLHDDARERGEPVAALYASEATIYGRFGYGIAVPRQRIRVRARALADIRGGDAGRVSLVTREAFVELAPGVAAAAGRRRAGMLAMAPEAWAAHARDDDPKRPDWYAAVGDRGVLRYRTRDGSWEHRVANGRLEVVDLVASDPEAEADLWAHVGSVDLVDEVEALGRPVDEALRWRLPDEARVRDRSDGPLYVRLLDLPAAMTARTYDTDDRVVFEVADAVAPDNAGRWALEAGAGGSTFTRTDDHPDVELEASGLASLWLGGVAPALLADAGRLAVSHADVLARLRRLFAVDRPPWTPMEF